MYCTSLLLLLLYSEKTMAYTSYFLTRFVFAKWTIGGFCQRVWVKTTWQRAERVLSSPWSWLAEPGLQKSPFSEPSLGHGGSAGRLPVPQVLPCLKNSYPRIFDNLQTNARHVNCAYSNDWWPSLFLCLSPVWMSIYIYSIYMIFI